MVPIIWSNKAIYCKNKQRQRSIKASLQYNSAAQNSLQTDKQNRTKNKTRATQPWGGHKDSLTPSEVVWLTANARYSQVLSVYLYPRTHPAPPP